MIRVAIVDDESLVRSGLRMILDSVDDIEVVFASDGVDADAEIVRTSPDVVLLDLRMPVVDGLSILARLRERPQIPKVAMLTTFDADEYVADALRLGAVGFLLKDTEPEQLIHAVRTLAAGGHVLSPAITKTVIGGYIDGNRDREALDRLDSLTDRERSVLALVGEGLSNVEIGQRLFLSVGTVKDHVSAILAKLGAANRVQAAVIAYRSRVAGPGVSESP